MAARAVSEAGREREQPSVGSPIPGGGLGSRTRFREPVEPSLGVRKKRGQRSENFFNLRGKRLACQREETI